MFGLFNSKKEIKVLDMIWKNSTAKYNGIIKNTDLSKNILFVYYFNETKIRMMQLMDAVQHTYSTSIEHENNITILQADFLSNAITDLSNRNICFLEHHPSFLKEQNLLQHLQNDDDCRIC